MRFTDVVLTQRRRAESFSRVGRVEFFCACGAGRPVVGPYRRSAIMTTHHVNLRAARWSAPTGARVGIGNVTKCRRSRRFTGERSNELCGGREARESHKRRLRPNMTAARSINLGVLVSVSDKRESSLTAVCHAGGVPQTTVWASSRAERPKRFLLCDCVWPQVAWHLESRLVNRLQKSPHR